MDYRKPPAGGEQREALAGQPEQLEHFHVAGAIDGGRTDDRPVEIGRCDQRIGLRFRPAIGGEPGFARGEAGHLNEAPQVRAGRSSDHRAGAVDIAAREAIAAGGVHDACDVDCGVGTGHQSVKRIGRVKRAIHPCHAVARRLRAAGEGADLMTPGQRQIDQRRSDESGAAGDGEGHRAALRHPASTGSA